MRFAAYTAALFAGGGILTPSSAQAPATTVLTGVVYDSAGRALEDARILARDLETGYTYSAQSSGTGRYWLPGLPPGRYVVGAALLGYAPVGLRQAVLAVGATVPLDLYLRAHPLLLEPIDVRAVAGRAASAESGVSFVFDRERLARVPQESRQLTDIASLAPGATGAPATGEQIASVGVGALGAYSTGIQLDGGNLMGHSINELSGQVPLLAVQEVGVVTTTYAAEFGQAASGLVNIATRRGSNRLGVEAFGLYRHRSLNSTGAFEDRKPEYERGHWGIALGGPIKTDRTHFFLAGERRDESPSVTIETRGLFPSAEGTFGTPYTDNLFFARLDHRVGDDHQLTFRYSGQVFDQVADVGESRFCAAVGGGGPGSYEQGVNRRRQMHSGLILDRLEIGAQTINEARLHVVGYAEERKPIGSGGTLVFPSLCAGSNLVDATLRNLRVEFKDDLSTVMAGRTGTHRLKFGVLAGWLLPSQQVTIIPRGAFVFPTDTSTTPAFALIGIGSTRLDVKTVQLAGYVQDDWNPVSSLTVNLGVRYDLETNSTGQGYVSPLADSLPFVLAEPRSADTDNFAPRVGFAWTPGVDRRTVVRGGFGLFFDQVMSYHSALERSHSTIAFVPSPGTTDASEIPIDTARVPRSPVVLGRRMPTPFTRQISLGVERVFPGGIVMRIDGILVQGRNLPITRELNTIQGDGTRRFPEYAAVVQTLNRGEALGKMLLLRTSKVFRQGWIDLAYTLADRRTATDVWFQRSPQVDPTDEDFSGELGPSAWDERHRLVGLGGLRLPLQLDLTGKVVYASGRPYTAVTGTDDNGDTILNDRLLGEGRNARRGPDFLTLDLGFTRAFRLAASEIRVRANVYNLLNRTNLSPGSVVGNLVSPLFGEALGALPGRQVELGLGARY